MAEIILAYPKTGMDTKKWACCLPLSLLHVASTLVKDFDVKIIDQRLDSNWRQTLKSSISDKTIAVGISSMTGKQIYNGLEISKLAKSIGRRIPVVWGGVHPTLMPEQTIENEFIDYVITGEGELSFSELVRQIKGKNNLAVVPGLFWKENGSIRNNPADYSFNLDDLPEIPYYLLNIEDYVSPSVYTYKFVKRLLPYFSSRGCPYRCIYCAQAAMYKSRYRKMNPELVYQRVSKLVSDYKLDCVDFYDDEFAVDASWITRIAELIGGRFKWNCQVRMDDLERLDLHKLHKNGLGAVKIGLESGSNKTLNYLKKRETVEIYMAVNKRLSKTDIIAQYNFMIGFPNEDKDDLFATIDLALALMRDNPNAILNSFSILTIYPGTELSKIVEAEYNMKLPAKLQDWSHINRQNITTPWTKGEKDLYLYLQYSSHFLCAVKRYVRKYKFVPGIIFDIYSAYLKFIYARKAFNKPFDYYILKFIFKYILKA
jgi:anaerobic magnesium-protoporphyrin IX monomethyl ester cyclase